MDIVVVGASVAGMSAVEAVRSTGFEGRITVVGAEDELPYDKPPLSKEFLAGDVTEADIALCTRSQLDSFDVELMLGAAVTHVDAEQRLLELSTGVLLPYDGVLLATGMAPRRLNCAGADLAGIHYLRTLDDARRLQADMAAGGEMVVIGTGFIGGEVASSGRRRGLDVTMVELAPAAFSGSVEPLVAEALTAAHIAEGVRILCGRSVVRFDGGDRVRSVVLSDGTVIAADIVVVGIGAAPQDGYLERSTLARADGVLCDRYCRTNTPAIYAAGDVCRWYNPRYERHGRVEHWTNAVEQGAQAARNLVLELSGSDDERVAYSPVPYFWSRQCERMFQYAGVRHESASLSLEGDVEGPRWAVTAHVGDTITSAFTANWPGRAVKYRRLLNESHAHEMAMSLDHQVR